MEIMPGKELDHLIFETFCGIFCFCQTKHTLPLYRKEWTNQWVSLAEWSKASDLKSDGVSPRRFKPCSWRIFLFLQTSIRIQLEKESTSRRNESSRCYEGWLCDRGGKCYCSQTMKWCNDRRTHDCKKEQQECEQRSCKSNTLHILCPPLPSPK